MNFAGVVQWQNVSFPSLRRGFDSLHPLMSEAKDLLGILSVACYYKNHDEKITLVPRTFSRYRRVSSFGCRAANFLQPENKTMP